jgi:hypothetical protein
MFFIVANPMIIRLPLPECIPCESKNLVGFARSKALPALHDIAHRIIRNRPENSVDVVRHDDPRIQSVAFAVEKAQRPCNQIRNISSLQPATALISIEEIFQFSKIVAFNLLRRIIRLSGFALLLRNFLLGLEPLEPPGAFCPVFKEHVFWQRICKTKCNKVTRPLTLHMRQETARMNSGPQRVGRIRFNTCGAKFKCHPINSRILFLGKHGGRIARAHHARQTFVTLQTVTSVRRRSAELHSAASQIFNLPRVIKFQHAQKNSRPAEFNSAIQQIENLRYNMRTIFLQLSHKSTSQ